MNVVLILLIVAAAGMVLFSLVRGLLYFAQSSDNLTNGTGPSAMHLAQNKMMFARVKWQAITILLLVALAAFASTQ